MWEPVGPLAPSVYWRRRVLALGVVTFVLGGFVWALVGLVGLVGLAGGEPEPATVEARARAAAMAGADPESRAAPAAADTDTRGPIEAALPDTPPGALPAAPTVGQPGAPPTVVPPGDGPGLAPTPVPDGALLVPPGGTGFRGFLPPGVPTGSAGPLLATPTTTPAPGTSVPPSTTTPTTTPPESSTASAPEPGPCADGDLSITARTDATSYPAGSKPVLSLVVTNTGDAPCVRDLDAAKQAVAVVRTPGDGLWGSNDCSPGDTDDVRTLAPGEEAVFSVRWSGKTSMPGCAGERTVVPPGTYQLLARLDGIISEPVSFTLAG